MLPSPNSAALMKSLENRGFHFEGKAEVQLLAFVAQVSRPALSTAINQGLVVRKTSPRAGVKVIERVVSWLTVAEILALGPEWVAAAQGKFGAGWEDEHEPDKLTGVILRRFDRSRGARRQTRSPAGG